MRPNPNARGAAKPEDLVTLWHVGGEQACQGPALKVPPDFLYEDSAVLPEGSELPDGTKLLAGSAPTCGTCGLSITDLTAEVSLSRQRGR